MKYRKFHFNVRIYFMYLFTVKVKHWNKSFRELVESSSWGLSKTQLDTASSYLLFVTIYSTREFD